MRPRIWARLLMSIITIPMLGTGLIYMSILILGDHKLLATPYIFLACIIFIALMGVLLVCLLVVFVFSYTKIYNDRIMFLGERFEFFPYKGTVRIDEIESVFLEQGRDRADIWVKTTIVKNNGTKIKWTMHFSDCREMFDAMYMCYSSMCYSSASRGKSIVSLSKKQFLLQRVSDFYSSVEFLKNYNSSLPFTKWPKAEPFSLELRDVLCVYNGNRVHFIFDVSRDFANACSFVNKQFSKSVRMGLANDGSLFTEEEAKWIAEDEHEDEIGCLLLFGAMIMVLLVLLFMLNMPKS